MTGEGTKSRNFNSFNKYILEYQKEIIGLSKTNITGETNYRVWESLKRYEQKIRVLFSFIRSPNKVDYDMSLIQTRVDFHKVPITKSNIHYVISCNRTPNYGTFYIASDEEMYFFVNKKQHIVSELMKEILIDCLYYYREDHPTLKEQEIETISL